MVKKSLFVGLMPISSSLLFILKGMKNKSLLPKGQIRQADASMLGAMQRVNLFPDKVVLFDTTEGMGLDGYIQLQAALLVFVERGTCRAEVDLKKYEMGERGIFLLFPGQVARFYEMSADFKPLCIGASKNMIDELMTQVEDSMRLVIRVQESPYMRLDENRFKRLVDSYRFLEEKMETTQDNVCRYSVIKHGLLSVVYECLGYLLEEKRTNKPTSRKDALFEAFVRNVMKKHRDEHGVQFYADELFVTPKYLTTVVENLSGKSAKRWIEEYLALDAKVMLKSSTKDIQEIASELNFADISVFGKFFKRVTGMSPKNYRQSGEE